MKLTNKNIIICMVLCQAIIFGFASLGFAQFPDNNPAESPPTQAYTPIMFISGPQYVLASSTIQRRYITDLSPGASGNYTWYVYKKPNRGGSFTWLNHYYDTVFYTPGEYAVECSFTGTVGNAYYSSSATTTVYVVSVDLDVDSNNDGSIDSTDDYEDKFEAGSPGAIVCIDKAGIDPNEDHYIELKLNVQPLPSNWSLKLSSTYGKVNVYQSSDGSGQINLGTAGNVSLSSLPSSLWIDGIALGNDKLTLECLDSDGKVICSDTVAVRVVDTISFSPSGTFACSWEPANYSGAEGLGSFGSDAIMNNIKDHGWDVTTFRYKDTTDDDDPGVCTLENFISLKYKGVLSLETHGTDDPVAACIKFFTTEAAAYDWWIGSDADTTGLGVGLLGEGNGYCVYARNSWFIANWQSMRNFVKGITVFGTCFGALGGEQSSVASAGGRVMLGYEGVHCGYDMEADFGKFFQRLNGSDEVGSMRVAKKAYDNGTGYTSGFKMLGNGWTTLGPSPQAVGKTGIYAGKGAGVIVFDTFMDSDIFSANTAVSYVSGSGSARRWFGFSGHDFGISFDYLQSVPDVKAEADNCRNEASVGRKLSGNKQTYGQDKQW